MEDDSIPDDIKPKIDALKKKSSVVASVRKVPGANVIRIDSVEHYSQGVERPVYLPFSYFRSDQYQTSAWYDGKDTIEKAKEFDAQLNPPQKVDLKQLTPQPKPTSWAVTADEKAYEMYAQSGQGGHKRKPLDKCTLAELKQKARDIIAKHAAKGKKCEYLKGFSSMSKEELKAALRRKK